MIPLNEKQIILWHVQNVSVEDMIKRFGQQNIFFNPIAIQLTIDHYDQALERAQKTCDAIQKTPIPRFHLDEIIYATYYTHERIGHKVRVCPVAGEYEDKTLEGVYIGDVDLDLLFRQIPVLFAPLQKICILGCESFWAVINSDAQVLPITTEEIKLSFSQHLRKLFGK